MKNVGNIDRIIRLVIGFVFLSLFFVLEGYLKWISLLGVVAIITALTNYCPLYTVCKINTKK